MGLGELVLKKGSWSLCKCNFDFQLKEKAKSMGRVGKFFAKTMRLFPSLNSMYYNLNAVLMTRMGKSCYIFFQCHQFCTLPI